MAIESVGTNAPLVPLPGVEQIFAGELGEGAIVVSGGAVDIRAVDIRAVVGVGVRIAPTVCPAATV